MSKSYLFIYDTKVGTRETLKEVFSSMPEVDTWRFDMPNCFYIISNSSAKQLFEAFRTNVQTDGKYMFIEASKNRQGMMLKDTWYLLTHGSHRPKSGDEW